MTISDADHKTAAQLFEDFLAIDPDDLTPMEDELYRRCARAMLHQLVDASPLRFAARHPEIFAAVQKSRGRFQ